MSEIDVIIVGLPAVRLTHDTEALVAGAMATVEIAPLLAECAFVPLHNGFGAAHNSALDKCSGPGWIAAGDASISFDPISSQGLLHALFTGLAAAAAADRCLLGETGALDGYQQVIDGIKRSYWRHLAFCYAAETRWRGAPFWRRRSEPLRTYLTRQCRLGSPSIGDETERWEAAAAAGP